MIALALSSLPPRYVTRRLSDAEAASSPEKAVVEAVDRARIQVGRLPKHAEGAAVPAGDPVWVVNFPLEEGFRVVDSILRRQDGGCDCWNCRCDMVAFALNRYPARYGVEHKGQTHLFAQERERMRDELAAFLDVAVRVVTTVPRHDLKTAAA